MIIILQAGSTHDDPMEMSLKFYHLGFPLLERWGRHTFPYSSYEVPLKSLDIIDKANIKELKGGEKKSDQLGVSGSEERHGSDFPGFPFTSYAQDLELKKPATCKDHHNWSQWKPCGSLDFHLHPAIMKCLSPPYRETSEEAK